MTDHQTVALSIDSETLLTLDVSCGGQWKQSCMLDETKAWRPLIEFEVGVVVVIVLETRGVRSHCDTRIVEGKGCKEQAE